MKLNNKYTLSEKRALAGSYAHLANFLDSSPSAICHSIKKGRFSSKAVELMLELLAGITTIEQVKKDFEKYRPKGRGRPKKIEGVQSV